MTDISGDSKLRIVSDGSSFGTKVYLHSEIGITELDRVSSIEWRLDAGTGHAEARLVVHEVEVDVFGFGTNSAMGVDQDDYEPQGDGWFRSKVER